MYFTEEDLRNVIAWAIYRTSISLGIISKDDPMPLEDAVEFIARSKGHREAVAELADAYSEWYLFHLEIYKSGKSGQLSLEEQNKLLGLIQRRDNAKDNLMRITPVKPGQL